MRAVLQPRYGDADALVVGNIDKPIPGPGEVLVAVRAAGLNFGDKAILLGRPYLLRAIFGLTRPRNPVTGHDFAGVVEEVGRDVTGIQPGDEVFGESTRHGTCAEYVVVGPGQLARKPANVRFEEAAVVPVAANTALLGLRDACGVGPGKRVLVNGASGGVGTFAVQVAKALGGEVTAVCSTRNVAQAKAMGADEVIDYTREDYTTGEPRFDAVLDLVGNHTLAERRRVLKPGGIYVASFGQGGGRWLGPLPRIVWVGVRALLSPKTLKILNVTPNQELPELAKMLESGALKPVIEKTFPLTEAPDAFRVLIGGHARGKLVITP